MGKKIEQLHGILVGMGFKIAVSNRSNNFSGRRCSITEYRPYRATGYCIPNDFYKFDRYLKGGIYYDYRMISGFSRNRFYGGGPKYYEREPTKYIFRINQAGHSSKGCGSRPNKQISNFKKFRFLYE